jgi:hypothetical protein
LRRFTVYVAVAALFLGACSSIIGVSKDVVEVDDAAAPAADDGGDDSG